MSEDQPHRAFIGAYSGGADTDLTIPLDVLRAAERELDEARRRREAARAEAAEAQAAAKAARKRGLWQRLRAWMEGRSLW